MLNNTWCSKCGGAGCEVRAARGLKRLCEVEAPAPAPRSGYDTFAEAKTAAKPGQGVVGVRSGMGHGPMRYIIRGKAVA